jgi:predicted Zn-dependent protease with MMP-like domain
MNDADRHYFDMQLEQVLAGLPPQVKALLDEVPLIVDDYPTRRILRRVGLHRRDQLCGLYTGVPLTERAADSAAHPTDVIHLFRRGIWAAAEDGLGRVSERELRRQIRLTILHEFGHYHGLNEEQLEELGY